MNHWQTADRNLQYLGEQGVLADVIVFPYKQESSFGTQAQDERYLRYALARLAAYPNVIWCLVNEWNYTNIPIDYWNRMGRIGRDEDPWSREKAFLRAHSVHQQTRPDWNFTDQIWPSHAIVQLGVRNRGTSARIGDEWANAGKAGRRFRHGDEWGNHSIVRNWTGKYPVVNDEYGYIGEPQDDSEGKQPNGSHKMYTREKHRQTMWGIAAGGGYAAAGDKNLYDDGRPYKSGNWHDVPEHSDIQHLVDFFTRGGIEYWKMAPRNALVKSGTRVYALAEPGRQYLIYAAAGGSLSVNLAPGSYHARRMDPRTGATTAQPDVEGRAANILAACAVSQISSSR